MRRGGGVLWRSRLGQGIARAAPAGGVPDEHAALYEAVDVAQGRILGALGDLRPFRRRELADEAVEQAVDHVALAAVEGSARVFLPEARLPENRGEDVIGAIESAAETCEKPREPGRHIERALPRP